MLQNDAACKKTLFSGLIITDRVTLPTIEQEYRAPALPMDCHRRHLSSLFSPLFSDNFTSSGRVIVALKTLPLISADHPLQTMSDRNVLRRLSPSAHNEA